MERLLFAVFVFCISLPALGQANTSVKLDTLMLAAKKYVGFNGSIVIGDSKQVFYNARFGHADKAGKVLLNEHHQFNSGSIAKEFTTIAIMQLAERGKQTGNGGSKDGAGIDVMDRLSLCSFLLSEVKQQAKQWDTNKYSSELPLVLCQIL